MKLYTELATWWPLVSPPWHYVDEAAELLPLLMKAADATPHRVLELGSGGGSLAFHFKAHVQMTLSDISPAMLEQSRQVNPECEHIVGDMRTLDLGRTFDLVFIHDAVMYATDESALRATLDTAARHCRPGGGVVIVPDFVRETFQPAATAHGEDAGSATWNGSGTRIHATRRLKSPMRSSCATLTARCRSKWIGTSKDCSLVKHGLRGCGSPDSSRRATGISGIGMCSPGGSCGRPSG
jgi:SAM-dependent methyltransferase